METLFDIALEQDNARIVTAYGYYTINTRDNFDKGLTLFEHAVELDPHEPQYRKNLINLLVFMGKLDEAERRLQEFRTANTYGNSRDFCEAIEADIKTLRSAAATAQNE